MAVVHAVSNIKLVVAYVVSKDDCACFELGYGYCTCCFLRCVQLEDDCCKFCFQLGVIFIY